MPLEELRKLKAIGALKEIKEVKVETKGEGKKF